MMKRVSSFGRPRSVQVAVAFLLLTAALTSQPVQAKSWTCGGVIDARLFYPDYRSFSVLRFGFGASPPFGFGIGAAWYECFGNYREPWKLPNIPLVSPWLKYVGCVMPHADDDIEGNLPLTLYYVPFALTNRKGMSRLVVYSSLTANYWLARPSYAYLGLGVGTEFISLEAGWLRYEADAARDIVRGTQFRTGIHIGVGWSFRG